METNRAGKEHSGVDDYEENSAEILGHTEIITLVGQEDCDACAKTKKVFRDFNIPFIYVDFGELGLDVKQEIVRLRKKAKLPRIGLPFWIANGEFFVGEPNDSDIEYLYENINDGTFKERD